MEEVVETSERELVQEKMIDSMTDTVDRLCTSLDERCRVDVPFLACAENPGAIVKRTKVVSFSTVKSTFV